MTAYYNEIDPFAAAWLRELIKAGHIAPGDVDTRSIVDVRPDDLRKYTQCHFFAGIGVWSYALRRAGWPDDRPIWTGSCPCQPFSAAGKGGGFDDERHLWPFFHYLIRECSPAVVAGEQVASKDGLAWLDLVQADMEGTGYAFGAVDTCAAGFGAPHIRQRLYWIAQRLDDAVGDGRGAGRSGHNGRNVGQQFAATRADVELADATEFGRFGRRTDETGAEPGTQQRLDGLCAVGGVADDDDDDDDRREAGLRGRSVRPERDAEHGNGLVGLAYSGVQGLEGGDSRSMGRERPTVERNGGGEFAHQPGTGPTNGLWRAADWLFCRDGKWRPVEPGTFPLAHGAAARVGRLRGYGNAINAEQAQGFIEAFIETEAERFRLISVYDFAANVEPQNRQDVFG